MLVALTACGPPFTSNITPVDFGLVDGQPALTFCTGRTVVSVRLAQRPAGETALSDWEDVWRGEGRVELKRGDVLILSDSGELDGDEVANFDSSDGAKYGLHLGVESNSAPSGVMSYDVSFAAPPGGLRNGQWINGYGAVSETPCAS